MTSPLRRIRSGAISLAIVFLIAIAGYKFLAGYEWIESIWMVVITISTVGYSEGTQATPAVQLLTICVILLGVTSAAYTFGGFIQLMLEGEVTKALGKRKMTKELSKLSNHVIICGFGRLGQDLAHQLAHRNISFVVIDSDLEKVELANQNGGLAVLGDATSDKILLEARLKTARALITALPADAENVFITLSARNLRPAIQILAKSEHESSCKKLRQAGADKIVMPYRVGAQQMERMISRPTTAALFELFAEATNLEMELDELKISEQSPLVGLSLSESEIRKDFNLLVVAIKTEEGEFQFNPVQSATITNGDTLLVIGDVSDINRMKLAHQLD